MKHLLASGEVLIKAADSLRIDIRQVDQKSVRETIDLMVQQDPQLAWLKDAEARGDVDWRQVKEVHDSFKYNSAGLGVAAQLIIAIIVTYLTAGAASAALGSAAGATAGSGTAMAASGTATASAVAGGAAAGSTVAAGWANVALSSIAASAASGATISTINNRGNLGLVLKDVTSSDALRGYVVSGITAGLTTGVFDDWTATETATSTALPNSGAVLPAGGLSTWDGIGRFAGNQLLQNGTSTVLDRALGGDSALSDALRSSLASTFAAAGFNLVGDLGNRFDLQQGGAAKVTLHAVMGGLAAEAAGGDFKTGAVAAGLNEALVNTLAQHYAEMEPEKKQQLLLMNSQLLGVLAAAAANGDGDSSQMGAWVASYSTQYNYLTHEEVEDKRAKEKACADDGCVQDVREEYAELDEGRNKKLADLCRNNPGRCEDISAKLSADEPKLRALAKEAAAQGEYGASVVIGYVISSSNQDAQNIIASELSALEGGDGSRFLSVLGSTLLSATMGGSSVGAKGGSKTPKAVEEISNPPQAPVIPAGWVSRPGRNGGEIYFPAGTDPAKGEHIRVMPPGSSPVPGYENGYWRWQNSGKQPMNPATGKPGIGQGDTHVPLPPDSLPPVRR